MGRKSCREILDKGRFFLVKNKLFWLVGHAGGDEMKMILSHWNAFMGCGLILAFLLTFVGSICFFSSW